jgi:hypothetical protein
LAASGHRTCCKPLFLLAATPAAHPRPPPTRPCTHLSRDVLPKVLDAGDKLCPPQEVSGHAVEQAGVAGARGQADMQLVEVVLALRGGGSLLVGGAGAET